jgi:hypothetical protein
MKTRVSCYKITRSLLCAGRPRKGVDVDAAVIAIRARSAGEESRPNLAEKMKSRSLTRSG